LADRLRDLLAGPDGDLSPALERVFDALGAADNPKSLIRWCRRSPTAQLLAHLARDDRPLTHDRLDDLPQDLSLHFVRRVLVYNGVLPERAEYLERIVPWIDKILANCPPHHANLLRPYARWEVLRRARRLATRRLYTAAAGHSARSRILIALKFLVWLEERGQNLKTLRQADVDEWLSTSPTQRNSIRYFLAWAHRSGLTDRATVPLLPKTSTEVFLSESEHREQLRRCLAEEDLPLDARVAGALVLLFGMPLSQLVRLATDHIIDRDGHTCLQLNQSPVALPPRLATIVRQHVRALHASSPRSHSVPEIRWLFPGLMPGLPITPSALGRKLIRNRIYARPSRHSAMLALAADLPVPVLAELLGIHTTTAVRWSAQAARDWTGYVAQRATDIGSDHSGEE
jgi:hypothetical protein